MSWEKYRKIQNFFLSNEKKNQKMEWRDCIYFLQYESVNDSLIK